jgi:hypothetical protein
MGHPRRDEDRDGGSPTDLGLALLAGPAHWLGGGRSITTPILAVGLVEAVAIVGLGTTVASLWLTAANPPDPGSWLWLTLTVLGVVALACPLVLRLAGGVVARLPLAVSVLLRLLGIVLLVAMSTPLLSGWRTLLWWPACVVLGADVSLTVRALGRAETVAPLWSVVAAVIVTAVVAGDGWLRSLALVALVTDAFVVGGYVLSSVFLRVMARYERELARSRRSAVELEHLDRAHWIHDEVLGELRLARVQMQSGEATIADVRRELEEIEHRLRLKQVDQVLRTGRASVAEIMQPFLRMAQAHGATLVRVPSYEVGSIKVSETTGKTLKRCFSVPVTNALLAGARELSLDVRLERDELVVEIEDDAGGYVPSDEHHGRGLTGLRGELGEDAVGVVSSNGHTTVTCRVRVE